MSIESRQIADRLRIPTADAQQKLFRLEQGGLVGIHVLASAGASPMYVELTPSARKLMQLAPTFATAPQQSARVNLKVFLCHASEDRNSARDLYRRLKQSSEIDPWLDFEDILPGQDWDAEVRNAVQSADVVVICMSRRSLSKRGYVQREIRMVLDMAEEQPDETIFIILARLEPCKIPKRL